MSFGSLALGKGEKTRFWVVPSMRGGSRLPSRGKDQDDSRPSAAASTRPEKPFAQGGDDEPPRACMPSRACRRALPIAHGRPPPFPKVHSAGRTGRAATAINSEVRNWRSAEAAFGILWVHSLARLDRCSPIVLSMPIRLGDLADDDASLELRCRQCGRTVQLPGKLLAQSYGVNMSLAALIARMRCERDRMVKRRIVLDSTEASREAYRRKLSSIGRSGTSPPASSRARSDRPGTIRSQLPMTHPHHRGGDAARKRGECEGFSGGGAWCGAMKWTDLGALAMLQYPDPDGRLRAWARGFVRGTTTDTMALLKDLGAGVSDMILYQSRDAEGTQSPMATLDRGWGSCRDFAVLFAVRAAWALAPGSSQDISTPRPGTVATGQHTPGPKSSCRERAGSHSTPRTQCRWRQPDPGRGRAGHQPGGARRRELRRRIRRPSRYDSRGQRHGLRSCHGCPVIAGQSALPSEGARHVPQFGRVDVGHAAKIGRRGRPQCKSQRGRQIGCPHEILTQ